jgi:phosphate-selective porin OprO and OprP
VPDFGGSTAQLFDANLNYRFRPELQLKAGKFKAPVGFENLQSDATLPFNERSLVSGLVPSRNLGVQLWGDVGEGKFGYALGVFNGSGDGRNSSNSDFSDDKEFGGRLSFQPFKDASPKVWQGLGFGVGGTFSQISSNAAALPSTSGGTLPGYLTPGQQQFFAYNPIAGTVVADEAHWRISPYLSHVQGAFGLLGEWAVTQQGVRNTVSHRHAELDNTAWQVAAQWVLTGEPASFTGITPKRPFSWSKGGWGAWQLVGRYGQLDIDDHAFPNFANPASSASEATYWSAGINWWLNKNVRLLTSYSRTTFRGAGLDSVSITPPATVTRQDENAFFARLQLAF